MEDLMNRIAIVALVAALGALGCGSDADDSSSSGSTSGTGSTTTGGGNAACSDMSGTFKITGACGSDTCIITQTGCTTSLKCSGGSASYTGSISGADFTYSGTSGNGVPATCTGTMVGTGLGGTCKPTGGPSCNFAAAKQ
jgi:hypothetical protein